MPKGVMVVASGPADPSRDDEYNAWYADVHLPQVLAVPGIVGARRYRLTDAGRAPDPATRPYLAVYDLDADDLGAPVAELSRRSREGENMMSDVLSTDPPPAVSVYELIE